MKSTNPFDDDSPKVSTGGGAGTNPFSDDNEDPNPNFAVSCGGTSNSDAYFSANTIKNDDNTTAALNTVSMSHTTGSTVEPSSIMAGGPSESPWQDLGDLPYRRVHLYSNVSWGCNIITNNHKNISQQQQQHLQSGQSSHETNNKREMKEERFGLSWYPKSYVDAIRSHQNVSGDSEVARLLSTTTTTLVAGCPNGGPIAAVTIPLLSSGISGSAGGGSSGFGSKTTIRIMNNAGSILAKIPFPPPKQELLDLSTTSTATVMQHRGPGDILTIGFTSRCVLVVVLRDSLTLCYDLSGKSVLPPFFALKFNSGSQYTSSPSRGGNVKLSGTELLEARVYEGGVAVLGVDMNSAIVELLDEHDDPAYADGMDISSRRIMPKSTSSSSSGYDPTRGDDSSSASPFFLAPPPHYAIVTPLPTAMFARSKHLSFGCIAVLPDSTLHREGLNCFYPHQMAL